MYNEQTRRVQYYIRIYCEPSNSAGERLSRCTLGIGSNVAGLVKGKMYQVWDRDKHSQVWVRVKCKMCGIG